MSVSPNCSRSRASGALQRAGSPAPACSVCCTRAALRAALRTLCAAGVLPESGADAVTQAEGKIKGPARLPLKIQSAHGVGTARRLCRSVPRNVCMPRVRSLASVPSAVHCATLRWSLRRGSQ
jgi:hypothetical protein